VAATDEITLLQPITGAVDRFITRVRVTVDGESIDVDLDERSRTEPGQVVELPVDTFDAIRIEVLEDNLGDRSSYAALPGVGFAEVVIPGVVDDRVVRVPSVADNAAFDATAPPDRLTYVFTRERISAATPNRTAPEPRLVREFDVPDQRPFTVMGEVRLSASASDNTLQQALQESPSVVADRRLHGSVAARGASAIDGDRSTAWTTPVDDVVGAALTISAPIESNALSITWLDDDQHSVPTTFVLRGDGGAPRTLETATATAISSAAGLATATFDLGGYSAPSSVLSVETIEPRTVPEYFSRLPQVLPVAIAEIELDGGPIVDGPPSVDTGCRADLLTLDGEPLEVRIVGDRDLALSGGELQLDLCGGPIDLDLGTHRIDAASGSATGFDVDRLVLDADGAGAVPVDDLPPPQVDRRSATSLDVDLPASASPIWLTLNESWNPGWTATIDGADLGEPVLVGGYKNGWLVPADAAARVVELRWTPQRGVRLGFAVSAFGALLVLVILIITWPRRGSSRPLAVGPGADRAPTPLWSRRSLVAGAALALVLLLVGGVAAAVAVAITLLVTTHWRWWPAVAVLGLGAIVGGAIVALEWRRDYAAGPDWPSQFGWTAPLVWVLIAVVVTTAVFPSGAGPRWERRTGTRDADVVEAGR
jgi:hypothetical protein